MLRLMGKAIFHKGTTMPTAVKIKAEKYGRAIGMLLERGGTFQTRHQHTLIVNSEQRKFSKKPVWWRPMD